MDKNFENVNYLFFDAGGTLVDLNYSFLKDLVRERGYEAEEEALAYSEGKARAWVDRKLRKSSIKPVDLWNGYFAILFNEIVTDGKDMKEVIEHLWEVNASDGLWKSPVDGVQETLQELKRRGYPMSVISNAHGRVEKDLEDAGLASYFDYIFDSFHLNMEKPDPAIFHHAMSRVDVHPSESLYVGDVFSIDIVGANSAGMEAFLIDRYSLLEEVDCPKIKKLSDLLGYLKNHS
jgi:HAD superfamily hydrolase (TIGR01662 family)